MSIKIQLEVCVESLQSARIAEKAGAHRIELNSAIAIGGLTPSLDLLTQIKSKIKIPVVCMVRPRPGDFFYTTDEFELIQAETRTLLKAGADGIAVGCLDADGRPDSKRMKKIRSICKDKELVFHRAFDCTVDLDESMQSLIDVGIDRVLTSGGASTAIVGQWIISRLQLSFGQAIQVLPGSGINSGNIESFLEATGCTQVHGTFRGIEQTGSQFVSTINFNESLGLQADQKYESSRDEIEATLQIIDQLN